MPNVQLFLSILHTGEATDGDSAIDAMARIRKASQTFAMVKSIKKSKQLRLETKQTVQQ